MLNYSQMSRSRGSEKGLAVVKAVVFEGVGRLNITDVPDPGPGSSVVVTEVAAVGISGTDVHLLDRVFEGAAFPLFPGHEAPGMDVMGPMMSQPAGQAGEMPVTKEDSNPNRLLAANDAGFTVTAQIEEKFS